MYVPYLSLGGIVQRSDDPSRAKLPNCQTASHIIGVLIKKSRKKRELLWLVFAVSRENPIDRKFRILQPVCSDEKEVVEL